jgi:acyl-CoA synthetase (AMP-forming)/AMP-acid ligase II
MTDGVYITKGFLKNINDMMSGDDVSIGAAIRGSAVKICEPKSTKPIARDMPGELHFSGSSLCNGYIGNMTDDFYTDNNGRKWLRTGDQARLDSQGRLFILGRYKELLSVVVKIWRLAQWKMFLVGTRNLLL